MGIIMLDLNDSRFYNLFPAFNLCSEVSELCQPLFKLINANYFDYNRVYPDNTYLTLSSDGVWLEHFFKRKFKLCTAFKQSGMHLWDSYYYQAATHEAKIHFNHTHGISIIYENKNYIEYIDIAASEEHRDITSFYLNSPDLIHQFVAHFKESAQRLIQLSEQKVAKLPEQLTIGTNETLYQDEYGLLKKFNLSSREFQCLNYYFAGKTAKETAIILKLSNRTVEEYFENLKRKMRCKHKRDLLKYFQAASNPYP